MGATVAPEEHRCIGIAAFGPNKGNRCTRPRYIDRNLGEETDYCYAHWVAQQPKDADGRRPFGGPQSTPENRNRRKPEDLLREMVNERIGEIVAPLFDALTAEKGVTIKVDGETLVEAEPDHKIRMDAANALLDRAHGKPVQRQERKTTTLTLDISDPGVVREALAKMRERRELEPAIDGTATEVTNDLEVDIEVPEDARPDAARDDV